MDSLRIDVVCGEPIPELKFSPDRIMRHEFKAWLPDEIIGLKVAGFVSEYATKVLRISQDLVKLRIGRRSWFPMNRYEYKVPFDLTIKFERDEQSDSSLARVAVELKPLSRNVPAGILNARAASLIRALRGCLMAESSEEETTDFHYH